VSHLIPQDDDVKGYCIKLSASVDEKILGSSVEILMSWCIVYVSHFPKKAVGEGCG
jgi:hypothetical protein